MLLDMVVRDKKGRPLNDLTANNVQVLDEGTPGKIMGLRLGPVGDAAGLGPQGANDAPRHARLVSQAVEQFVHRGLCAARCNNLLSTASPLASMGPTIN